MRTISTPAPSAFTTPLAVPKYCLIAPISMQSLKIIPWKPYFFLRSPVRIFSDMVAGIFSVSRAGKRMWVLMMAGIPASTPSLKGRSSIASSSSTGLSTTGRLKWESWAVSPWPGKCLAQASTFSDISPFAIFIAYAPTCPGPSP